MFKRATTDTGGVFYLDAPKAGTYRVAFMLPKSTMLSAPLTVSARDVQREFLVEVQRDEPTYFDFQVEKPVRALPGQQGLAGGMAGLTIARALVGADQGAEVR